MKTEARKAFVIGLSSGVLCTVFMVSYLQGRGTNPSSLDVGIPQADVTVDDVGAASGMSDETPANSQGFSSESLSSKRLDKSKTSPDSKKKKKKQEKASSTKGQDVSSQTPHETENENENVKEKKRTKAERIMATHDPAESLDDHDVEDTTEKRRGKYYSPITYDDLHQVPILKMPKDGEIRCPTDLESPEARSLDCRHRLPNVIGLGVEKCGTGAMSFFLEAHPSIVHADPREVYFWSRHIDRGLGWYMNRMPVSSKYQLTMEKTPQYSKVTSVPNDIKRFMPDDTKFILAFRDPYARAVSHFLHLKYQVQIPEYLVDRPLRPNETSHCFYNDTFESSVIKPDGSLMDYNCILVNGIYYKTLKRWLDVFPRDRFYFLDGDEFQRNPLPILKEIETFLGLPKYFDKSKIYFDEEKGFYCRRGYKKPCLGSGKGRPHPEVDTDVEERIRNFFRPHKRKLEELTGRTFDWT